jgi:hypothetical protein
VFASVALARTTTINPANDPSGTHLQSAIGCESGRPTVTCSAFDLPGVGNTNAVVSLTATYSGVVDYRNKGRNIVESHETTFSVTSGQPIYILAEQEAAGAEAGGKPGSGSSLALPERNVMRTVAPFPSAISWPEISETSTVFFATACLLC